MVLPPGVEPKSSVPETDVLSIELRELRLEKLLEELSNTVPKTFRVKKESVVRAKIHYFENAEFFPG